MVDIDVDAETISVMNVEDTGIARVKLYVSTDLGETFRPIVIRFNPLMKSADLQKVMGAELAQLEQRGTPETVKAALIKALGQSAKTYPKVEPPEEPLKEPEVP